MRQPTKTALVSALLTALVLAGCGSGASTVKVAKVILSSPAFSNDTLPARYTCDGQNVSPPLEWGTVPKDVGSLALFVVSFTPGPAKTYSVAVQWALAGVNPALHRLAAGQLPRGAYLAVNAHGQPQRYSLCPKKGTTVQYQFELYGVPSSLGVSRDFSGLPVLDLLAYGRSGTRATAHGAFVAIYKRPA
jgi:phosphatidylethanolamine-binding protein (PEBP) family uncharacterized protein